VRPPVLAALLTVTLCATLCATPALAQPFLVAETDYGSLEVVPLQEFDPPAAGDEEPPAVEYWTFSSFEPVPLEDRDAVTAQVVSLAENSRAALAGRGLIDATHTELGQLSPREFVLVVGHLTRAAVTVPLTPAGVDEHSLEQYLADGHGVCRHLSRIGEAVAELLRPHCPAARDVRITAYGDHHTHSWLRAAALVPDGELWRLLETHFDLTSHTPDELFADVDMVHPRKLQRYPLAALVLDRAGLHDGAQREFRAFVDRPDSINRAAAWTELLRSHLARAAWREALVAAPEALDAIDAEQALWDQRSIPTTPDQLIEMRLAIFQALDAIHTVFPERWAETGLPSPEQWAPEIERLSTLHDQVSVYAFALEGDLDRLDLAGARERMERGTAGAGDDAWAYPAIYAAVLERAKAPVSTRKDSELLLELAVERHLLVPADERAAADLANALMGRVDTLDRRGAAPTARDLELLAVHDGALPEGLPESHLVRAWVAGHAGNAAAQRRAYQAVITTCDGLTAEQRTPREELFRILAMVELERIAADAGATADAERHAADALAALEGASTALRDDPDRHEPLAILWWDAGIRLTIVDSNQELAVQIWRAFVAWDPDDPRARYGLARGLVQLAIAQLEGGEVPALPVAREAVRALRHAVALEVPVPNSGEYLRLAWFNLATRFESHGELEAALEISRGMAKALPGEPGGPILVARALGRMAADARTESACGDVAPYLDEGEALLAGLPAIPTAAEHLVGSAVNATRSLAIGAATCGDLDRALATLDAGLERFPAEPGLVELREQVLGRGREPAGD